MLYIVTALFIEAKPLINLFNLKKNNEYAKFQVFSNEKIKLIISGTGKVKSATALTYLLSNEELKQEDFIINIGFVASSDDKDKIGDIVYPNKITSAYSENSFYTETIYKHFFKEVSLYTFDKVIEEKIEDISYIDMESSGFYQAASIFFKRDKIIVLKIISDILKANRAEREVVDFKDESIFTDSYQKIYDFLNILLEIKNENIDLSEEENLLAAKLVENLKLTATMTNEFLNILKFFKIKYGSINFLEEFLSVEVKSKKDTKENFEKIKEISKYSHNKFLIKNDKNILISKNNKNFFNTRFSHIYIEKEILNHKNTIEILEKFKNSKIIEIDNYKEIFSSNNQDFRLQKNSQNLILASNKSNMIYEGAKVCESFANDNFYYTSSIINCVYDCEYCYLQGVYPSGNIVIFVDIEEVFEKTNELYKKLKTLYLCISYDTDLLAIENICSFCEKWYNFISDKKDLKIELRTKSGNIEKFLKLKPLDNYIIAFTLSPEEISLANEKYTVSFKKRVEAIVKLQEKGWKVRICIDPIIYTDDFEDKYSKMIDYLFEKIDRNLIIDVSIGVFRISKDYLKKMRQQNKNSEILYFPFECEDGVYTYSENLRNKLVSFVKNKLLNYVEENKIYI